MDLNEKANELIGLHIRKKDIANELAKLELSYEDREKDLYKEFVTKNIDEFSINGYTLRPVLKFSAVVKNDKTIRVMRRRGYKDLVKPTIHPSTVHAFIRRISEENDGKLPQWVADNFKISNKGTISIRKD
ncbi:MAG: hypothetical protein BWY11_00245 [Firmicutes bacterium ADurb.Bin182]|nr:MAG: hypothetical protein BWY11_00245 [Firmicutes bacterium ADurb.Bin182]